jgi:succinate dehydrogenase/fumarate reductase-like Fe-S protein
MSRTIKIFRFDPETDAEPRYEEYEIADIPLMSIMDVLDFVYDSIDSSLSYYSHSRCDRGVCARCVVRLNGKNVLSCQTPLPEAGEVIIEPTKGDRVIKDLVVKK